jgi:methylisocitrate lyase
VAVYGIEDAIDRANAYYEAGADIIYIEAPISKDMMEKIRKEVKCNWLMSVYVEGGVTPLLSTQELIDLGFKFVIHPPALFFVVTKAMQTMLKKFKEEDSVANCKDMMLDFSSANDVVRLDEIRALEKSFSVCE